MSKTFWTLLIGMLITTDQVSKWLVENYLLLYRQVDIFPFLSLFRTYNEGVAFSAFSGLGQWPLVVMVSVITVFVFWLWRSVPDNRLLSEFGYALVIAGALGNLIDRIRIGKVVDMIYFHIDAIGFHFAVFNLADTFITLGAMAIITDEFLNWRKKRQVKT